MLRLTLPAGARCDMGVAQGGAVTPAFDPLLGKLIVHGATRAEALAAADAALAGLVLLGVETNIAYLRRLLADPDVVAGRLHTGLIGDRADLLAEPEPAAREALLARCCCTAPRRGARRTRCQRCTQRWGAGGHEK